MEGVFSFMLVCYKLFSNIELKGHERPIQTKKLTIVKKSRCYYHIRHIDMVSIFCHWYIEVFTFVLCCVYVCNPVRFVAVTTCSHSMGNKCAQPITEFVGFPPVALKYPLLQKSNQVLERIKRILSKAKEPSK